MFGASRRKNLIDLNQHPSVIWSFSNAPPDRLERNACVLHCLGNAGNVPSSIPGMFPLEQWKQKTKVKLPVAVVMQKKKKGYFCFVFLNWMANRKWKALTQLCLHSCVGERLIYLAPLVHFDFTPRSYEGAVLVSPNELQFDYLWMWFPYEFYWHVYHVNISLFQVKLACDPFV